MKISELTPKKPPLDATDMFIIEEANGTLRSVSKTDLEGVEIAARSSADTQIIDGVGLNVDGSYPAAESSNFIKSADFTNAGLGVSIGNALKLLDGAVHLYSNQQYITQQLHVEAGAILTLKETPVLLVAAPSNDVFVDVLEVFCNYVKETTDYTTDGYIYLTCNDVAVAQFSSTLITNGDAFEKALLSLPARLTTASPIMVTASATPVTGDGIIDITIMYRLVNKTSPAVPLANNSCCTLSTSGTFTAADLSAESTITITHSFGTQAIAVTVYDETNTVVYPEIHLGDAVGEDLANKVTIIPIEEIIGTWRYVIVADNPNV